MSELSAIVETGPDPEVDGVVRWRRIDLKRVIEERFGVMYVCGGAKLVHGAAGITQPRAE